MKKLLAEFKTFALRGNVMDLAVAVVIGTAFGKIVSSLVDNLLLPAIGFLLGVVTLSHFELRVGTAVIQYGAFLQNVIDFLIVAWVVFLFVKLANRVERAQR